MIRIFSSPNCAPCVEVERRIKDGKLDGQDVEIIDVESDEGFKIFQQELERIGATTFSIPSAIIDDRQCEVRLLGDGLAMNCGV